MSTPDIRAALDRLHQYAVAHSEHDTAELVAAARAALAAEPVGEGPTLDDISDLCDEFNFPLREDETGNALCSAIRLWEMANAILARWSRPAAPPAPEPGEVGELVAWLRSRAGIPGSPDFPAVAAYLTRAADLLEQQAAPAPVAVVSQAGEGE